MTTKPKRGKVRSKTGKEFESVFGEPRNGPETGDFTHLLEWFGVDTDRPGPYILKSQTHIRRVLSDNERIAIDLLKASTVELPGDFADLVSRGFDGKFPGWLAGFHRQQLHDEVWVGADILLHTHNLRRSIKANDAANSAYYAYYLAHNPLICAPICHLTAV